ncbi:MAG: hypothetical protein K6G24_07465, partial [Lachnospiraceae bacterium]|nr:hypothetical protein [Lachnospiraceae bacterium]
MKLKYYMRGIGVGIIFSIFIFRVIVIPNLKLENKIENNTNTETNQDDTQAGKLVGQNNTQPTSADDVTGTATPKATEEPTITPEATDEPTEAPEVTDEPTATAEPTEEPEITDEPTEA